uniref:Uncharacterized protein n=1 Tax=Rhizophora mucronata TaxID=61149 RepID=A0A2P2PZB5_RHIMU
MTTATMVSELETHHHVRHTFHTLPVPN